MKILFASDFHFPDYYSKFCLDSFFYAIKHLKPDRVCLVGDIFDFYQVSKFEKDVRRMPLLQEEINATKELFFLPLSKLTKNVDYILGNHEMRLQRFLRSKSPALSTLDSLSISGILELKKFNIGEPRKFKYYSRNLLAIHGTYYTNDSARKELRRWGVNGVSGHSHVFNIATSRVNHKSITWVTLGAMCRTINIEYTKTGLTQWTQGFALAVIDKNDVLFKIFEIKNKKIIF